MHLDDWYAQSHPDEDFAETFAVWLTPGLDWRKRYAGWKALQKLEYVDELMRSLAGKPPMHHAGVSRRRLRLSEPQAQDLLRAQTEALRRYLSGFLRRRSAPALRRAGRTGRIKASSYLRRRRRRLLNSVCQWTNEKKFRVNKLLARLIDRCDQLELHVLNDDPQQDFRVSAFITTLVMNYLFTGKFKRTK